MSKTINYKIYKLTAMNTETKEREVLFSSYVKSEVTFEKEHAYDFQDEYKKFKIEIERTTTAPCPKIYCIADKAQFVRVHTPDFNFELSPAELIKEAVEQELIEKNGDKILIIDFELENVWKAINKAKEEEALILNKKAHDRRVQQEKEEREERIQKENQAREQAKEELNKLGHPSDKQNLKEQILDDLKNIVKYTSLTGVQDAHDLREAIDYDGTLHHLIDGFVSIYYHEIRKWAAVANNWEWVELAHEEGLIDREKFDYHAAIQAGQYLYIQEIAHEVLEESFNDLLEASKKGQAQEQTE